MDFNNTELPLQIIQGEAFILPIYFTDDDGEIIPLGAFSAARMQARQTVNSEDPPLFDWSTDTGEIVIYPSTGFLSIAVSGNDTALLPAGWAGVYDLFLLSPDGLSDERVISGKLNIVGRITR